MSRSRKKRTPKSNDPNKNNNVEVIFKPNPNDLKYIESLLQDIAETKKQLLATNINSGVYVASVIAAMIYFYLPNIEIPEENFIVAQSIFLFSDMLVKNVLISIWPTNKNKEEIAFSSQADVDNMKDELKNKLVKSKVDALTNFFMTVVVTSMVIAVHLGIAKSYLAEDQGRNNKYGQTNSLFLSAVLIGFLIAAYDNMFSKKTSAKQKNADSAKAEDKKKDCSDFVKQLPKEIKADCEYIEAVFKNNSYYLISLTKKYKLLSFSEVSQIIKSIFLRYGIEVSKSSSRYIFLKSDAKLPSDCAQLSKDIEQALTSLNVTKIIGEQLTRMAKIMDVEYDYEPYKANNNTYRYKYFLKVPTAYQAVVTQESLKNIFFAADVTLLAPGHFMISTSQQGDDAVLKLVEDSLKQIKLQEAEKSIPKLDVMSKEDMASTDRQYSVTTSAEPPAAETKDEPPPTPPPVVWPSGATFFADRDSPVKPIEVSSKSSYPKNSLFYIWEVPEEVLSPYPGAEKAFKDSAGIKAERRQNCQGVILMDGEKVQTDNNGEIEAVARIKRKGSFGNMGVFASRKETAVVDGQTKTVYVFDSFKNDTHIKF